MHRAHDMYLHKLSSWITMEITPECQCWGSGFGGEAASFIRISEEFSVVVCGGGVLEYRLVSLHSMCMYVWVIMLRVSCVWHLMRAAPPTTRCGQLEALSGGLRVLECWVSLTRHLLRIMWRILLCVYLYSRRHWWVVVFVGVGDSSRQRS